MGNQSKTQAKGGKPRQPRQTTPKADPHAQCVPVEVVRNTIGQYDQRLIEKEREIIQLRGELASYQMQQAPNRETPEEEEGT